MRVELFPSLRSLEWWHSKWIVAENGGMSWENAHSSLRLHQGIRHQTQATRADATSARCFVYCSLFTLLIKFRQSLCFGWFRKGFPRWPNRPFHVASGLLPHLRAHQLHNQFGERPLQVCHSPTIAICRNDEMSCAILLYDVILVSIWREVLTCLFPYYLTPPSFLPKLKRTSSCYIAKRITSDSKILHVIWAHDI